jgi:hypothetical protein
MLTDPLKVNHITAVSAAAGVLTTTIYAVESYAVVDLAPGKTVRKCTSADGTVKSTLTISHSVSNENAPFLSDRTLIRFDQQRVNEETGKNVTASVYANIVHPQGGDFTAAVVHNLVRSLGAFLLSGESNGTDGFLADENSTIQRIIAGEP